jgi:hypothetical protein
VTNSPLVSPAHRLVLCPYGQPRAPAVREHWDRQIQRCGGDLARVIDGPAASLDQFARHLSRVAVLKNPRLLSMVVLARSNPLAMSLLGARRALPVAAPALDHAPWAVFVDPAEDPFFEATAATIGELSGALETAPIWRAPDGHGFLVLSPLVADLDVLGFRVAELLQPAAQATEGGSSPRRGSSQSARVSAPMQTVASSRSEPRAIAAFTEEPEQTEVRRAPFVDRKTPVATHAVLRALDEARSLDDIEELDVPQLGAGRNR